jgi:hypothetical protein
MKIICIKKMNHPVCQISDIIAVFVTVVTATAAPLVLAAAPNSELLLLLLPLLGSLLMTGSAILLNPEIETRKIVVGRSIIALLFGVAGPHIIAMFLKSFDPTAITPVILVLVGAMVAFASYILSRPFFDQAYSRAESIAKSTADEIERRAGIPPKPKE